MIYNGLLCNKHFKSFVECQMSKDKPTHLFQIKMWNFYTILMRQSVIVFTYSQLFLDIIYHVTTQVISLSHRCLRKNDIDGI